jgi:hypothetical protein
MTTEQDLVADIRRLSARADRILKNLDRRKAARDGARAEKASSNWRLARQIDDVAGMFRQLTRFGRFAPSPARQVGAVEVRSAPVIVDYGRPRTLAAGEMLEKKYLATIAARQREAEEVRAQLRPKQERYGELQDTLRKLRDRQFKNEGGLGPRVEAALMELSALQVAIANLRVTLEGIDGAESAAQRALGQLRVDMLPLRMMQEAEARLAASIGEEVPTP